MNIEVISDNTNRADNTNYRYVQMRLGKREVNVMKVSGKHNYVSVVVKNASHRVYRGPGKEFKTAQEAIDNYKTEDIKEMIRYVCWD